MNTTQFPSLADTIFSYLEKKKVFIFQDLQNMKIAKTGLIPQTRYRA